MSATTAADLEGEAWDALYETQAARCCDCVSCNHYLPHTEAEAEAAGVPMYQPDATCVLRAAVERIVAAREIAARSVAILDAASIAETFDTGPGAAGALRVMARLTREIEAS